MVCSCKAVYLKIVTKKDVIKSIKVLRNENTDQTIIFIPTVHVGKVSYYESFKPLIDSLRKENYIIFKEGLKIVKNVDNKQKISYQKKFRKILGIHLDTERTSYLKNGQLKNYVLQNYAAMGVYESDSILDLGIDGIIDSLEIKHGEIKLNFCDIETPLTEKYQCKKRLKKLEWDALQTFRNEFITGKLKKSKEKKIVLLYGKSHWHFIYAPLNNLGFRLIQGKI